MKIIICDIDKWEEDKIVVATRRTGFKGNIKIDVCDEHKDFFKGIGPQEAYKKFYAIVNASVS